MCAGGMVRGLRLSPLPLFYNDHFHVPLPLNHRFPMPKYALVRQALQKELTPRGLATFHPSPLASLDELTACHTADYVDRYVNNKLSEQENRRVGFPWSQASVDRSLSSTGGMVAAMREVCTTTAMLAGHLAGGTHHAFADRGEGYCVFNGVASHTALQPKPRSHSPTEHTPDDWHRPDASPVPADIGVAARVALRDYLTLIRTILVVDLDVHQGNGCAVIFQERGVLGGPVLGGPVSRGAFLVSAVSASAGAVGWPQLQPHHAVRDALHTVTQHALRPVTQHALHCPGRAFGDDLLAALRGQLLQRQAAE